MEERVYCSSLICIDSYADRIPVGAIFNPYRKRGIRFCGVAQLLKEISHLLNSTSPPSPISRAKSYSSRRKKYVSPKIPAWLPNRRGKVATFSLTILFRQNASWQGTVTWFDQRKQESFRSVLELIMLLDSALTDSISQSPN